MFLKNTNNKSRISAHHLETERQTGRQWGAQGGRGAPRDHRLQRPHHQNDTYTPSETECSERPKLRAVLLCFLLSQLSSSMHTFSSFFGSQTMRFSGSYTPTPHPQHHHLSSSSMEGTPTRCKIPNSSPCRGSAPRLLRINAQKLSRDQGTRRQPMFFGRLQVSGRLSLLDHWAFPPSSPTSDG